MPSLKKLLNQVVKIDDLPKINIVGLSLDCRKIKKGDLFFAYQGTNIDSKKFIDVAINKGATAILCDTPNSQPYLDWRNNIPIIAIPNLSNKIGNIATNFYANPARNMRIIGITGTNGKTSTSYLLTAALEKLGIKTGLIGTLGYGTINNLQLSDYTTPNSILLQKILHGFKQQNINTVVMEVSSHALAQKRFADINISLGTFTNLTHDHLDYHQNMQKYAAAKRRLFELTSIQHAIFNLDDPVGLQWMHQFQQHKNLSAYGYTLYPQTHTNLGATNNIISAHNIQLHLSGISAAITSPWGTGNLNSALLGKFNISNLLAVISNLCSLGYQLNEVLKIIPTLQPVPGRMQTLGGKQQPLIVVDFSHTPDALEKALQTLQEHCQGKLLCVFGCGGDRDRSKRPEMAQIAENLADIVIVTNDNVRSEDPQQIIKEIMTGFKKPAAIQIEPDRTKAISLAIQQATAKDIILLAGKGHEPYQIIGDKIIPFSDVEVARKLLQKT
jgi:UDP-N-acetylmuramoyl-L-alanyl-D-glutamate--2,6-diaminopimelate ligase